MIESKMTYTKIIKKNVRINRYSFPVKPISFSFLSVPCVDSLCRFELLNDNNDSCYKHDKRN